MKKNILWILGFLASASSAFAAADLKCVSYDELEGWNGGSTHGRLILKADVLSGTELLGVKISGPFTTDVRDLTADANYKPRNPRYAKMNRFSVLEDAWCWYAPLLPKNLDEIPMGQKFTAYVQQVCEGGRASTFGLFCSLQ